MSKRSRDSSHDTVSLSVPASGSAVDSAPGDSNLKSESAIVDKLTLIKSYELTLKNQGLAPIEDSRIYKLLFRVVYESEQYVEQNKKYMKTREMARIERLSLL